MSEVEAHSGGSGAVWLFQLFKGGDIWKMGVFSSAALGEEWVMQQQPDRHLRAPFFVDVPEFGTKPEN